MSDNEQIWQMPEMYDYALDTVIPKPGTFVPLTQWNLLGQIISYNSDGRMNAIISRLLDLSASQGKLDDLLARVEAARKEIPGWKAGGIFKALIDCRLGRFDQAQAEVRQLLAQTKDDSIPSDVYWIVGSELENHAATHDLAVTAYETSAKLAAENQNQGINFDYGPTKRLVSIYVRDKRLEDARKLLVDVPKTDNTQGYPDGYLEQMKMQSLGSAAGELLKLGFAADAVTLYNESIGLAKEIPADSPNYIGNREGLLQQQREGLTRALDELRPEDLAASVTRMIASSEAAAPKKNGDANQGSSKTNKGDPLLNLVVLVHPRELDKATIRSLLADTIAASGSASSPDELKARDQLAATLEESRKIHPDDLSLAIGEALLALGSGETKRIEPALARLDELVEKNPLEVLEAGGASQFAAARLAAEQIPLWLVARACWKQKNAADFKVVAEKLAARAQEAARRQSENSPLLAMLREQGELALARGDRAGAEAAWSQMLKLVVEPTDRTVKKPPPKPTNPAASAVAPRAIVPGQPRAKAAGP